MKWAENTFDDFFGGEKKSGESARARRFHSK
jgi:hypothetical protein